MFVNNRENVGRFQWPCGLKCGSEGARLLGLRIRIPPVIRISVSCKCVCFQVEVSASGWSLVQRIPTKCGVSEDDREASIISRLWPTGGCCATGKKVTNVKVVLSYTIYCSYYIQGVQLKSGPLTKPWIFHVRCYL